jgi:hypothetical protein
MTASFAECFVERTNLQNVLTVHLLLTLNRYEEPLSSRLEVTVADPHAKDLPTCL